MGLLEGRAEETAGTFKSLEITNTLWAFATTGQKPGERLMGMLEGRAKDIAGMLNTQDVANKLWATCILCIHSRALLGPLTHILAPLVTLLSGQFSESEVTQLHQVFLSSSLEEGLGADVAGCLL